MSDIATRRAPGARVQNLPQQPPHSIEAEQSVLGGLLLNNKAFYELADKVFDEDFYRADHRLIFRGISELIQANKPCDFVTLSEHLRHQGRLEEAGGVAYLGTLAVDTHSVANVIAYAEIVHERATLRGLIAAGAEIGELGFRPEGRAPGELVDAAEQKVFALRERGARGQSNYESIGAVVQRVEQRIEQLRIDPKAFAGLPTGFVELDRRTQGMHPGDLIIVAARPGCGKCLAWDSELVMDDGSVTTIQEVFHRKSGRVGTLLEGYRIGRAEPSDYIDDGMKPAFEVVTRLGRKVETTSPHPFLTIEGWKPLSDLNAGDWVATPRALPVFGSEPMRECEVKLLAYLIGDGGLTGTSPRFTTTNPVIEREFRAEVAAFGGCVVNAIPAKNRAQSFTIAAETRQLAESRHRFAGLLDEAIIRSGMAARAVAAQAGVSPAAVTYWRQGRQVPNPDVLRRVCRVLRVTPDDLYAESARHNAPNPITRWLQLHQLYGKGAGAKTIPARVFRLPREQVALFLSRLFGTDGWASVGQDGQPQIGYATICEKLARQVQHLLLRFGIIGKLRLRWVRYRDSRRPCWDVTVSNSRSVAAFVDQIGIYGKDVAVQRVREAAERKPHDNIDLLPVGIWKILAREKGAMSWAELARKAGVNATNLHVGKRGMSRRHLLRFAEALSSSTLIALAQSDVYWDRIESITPTGLKQVYDLTIPETHNFIANDICVHNTSLAMNIAEHVAFSEKQGVAVFSMEMSGDQLTQRIISSFGRIELGKLRSGRLDAADMDRLVSAGAFLREAKLFIDETGALSPLELRARARRLASQHGIKLIVVDYIQLMQVPGTRENRTNEVSEITRSLKALAKELRIPIIALSQLSRANEKENRKPKLSDLRDSGGIEQDADMVLFIHRDEAPKDEVEDRTRAEIIIGKQRSGPTGHFDLLFLGQYTKFDNPADQSFSNL